MQYQKSEVRKRILRVAGEEFLRRGFLGARIGAIAESADVPVGNLYRYFGCKDVLFEAVVGQTFTLVPQKIRCLFENCMVKNTSGNSTKNRTNSGKMVEGIVALFEEFGRDIIILMDGSEGSDFSDFADSVYDICQEFFESYSEAETEDDGIFCRLISRSAVDMVVQLFRSGDKGLLERLLPRLIANFETV